ncbi:MAG TPA: lipopolysaccharide biosynthesis protein [Xanthobacteraceae bacterium]|nr:lipopolysaccharide biosynthesis protein [Xanthobacteraceae bacterium]
MRFVRNSMYGALAGGSLALGNLISAIIVARLLGASGMGAVSYAVWLVLSITPIIECGIPAAVGRYVPEMRGAGEAAAAEVLAARLMRALTLVAAVSATALLLVILLIRAAAPADGTAAQIANGLFGSVFYAQPVLLAGYAAVQVVGAFGYAYLRGRQQFDLAAHLAWIALALQLVGVGIGSLLYGAAGAVVGYAAGQLVPAVVVLVRLSRSGAPKGAIPARIRRYSAFAWAANIANTFVWARIEMFFLAYFWGDASVGLLAVTLSLANLATQPPLLMTSGVLTLLSEQSGRRDRAGIQTAYAGGTTMLAALVLPAAFCMAAITPVLLPMLYGQEFAPAVPAAAILVCVAGIGVANSMATNLVYALERSDFVFYTSAVGGVLAISAALVLVPRWGLMGAVVGRAAVQLAMVAAGVSFVWYRLGFHASIRSLTRIVIASSLSAAVAWLAIACVPAPLSLALALVGGGLTYLVLLVVLQAFSRDELDLMAHVVRTLPPSIGGAAARILSLFSIAAGGLPPAAWRRGD